MLIRQDENHTIRLFNAENCVRDNAALLSSLGKRCFIVCGKTGARKSGALDDALRALETFGAESELFDGIEANPKLSDCMRAGKQAHAFRADFILGIGGGSAMDAAKAVCVLAANPDLDEKAFYEKAWTCGVKPLALIVTAAGTGSEVTDVSVLTDGAGRKHSIHDPALYASLAFDDVRYTATVGKTETLSMGVDILAHCVESYFNKNATEQSRLHACAGVKTALPALKRVASGEEPVRHIRQALIDASIEGGLAISKTGTCFPHNVGYYLTERFHVRHGFASAAFLPDLLALEKKQNPQECASFARLSGVDPDEIARISRSLAALDEVRLTPAEIGEALPRWENNRSVKNTLGTVTTDDIKNMLYKFIGRERQ